VLALGRGGRPEVIASVVGLLDHVRPVVRSRAAIALGLLVKKHGKAFVPVGAIPKLARMARDPDRETRYGATYALMRFAHPEAGLALVPTLADGDAEIRAQSARGLGLAGAAPALLDPVLDDADVRVRVEVVRALGLVGSSTRAHASAAANRIARVSEKELARWADPNTTAGSIHVLTELVKAALDLKEEGDRALEILAADPPPAIRPIEKARMSCAIAHALDSRQGVVERVKTCGGEDIPAWRRLELEAQLLGAQQNVDALRTLAANADERARTAAVDAISGIDTPAARAALVALVSSADPFVSAGAAGSLRDAFSEGERPSGAIESMSVALAKLKDVADPGLMVGVLDAIGALKKDGVPFLADLDRATADPRPAVRRRAAAARAEIEGSARVVPGVAEAAPIELATGRLHARIETTAGVIEAVLFGDVAPRTVARFAALARAGYYKDRSFHRVVPDFVVQGGCPRGDGSGGPGEAMLDETSPLPFVRGALGIATAGRDTGGSQYFAMHAYHPHLSGGYTLFGQIVSGLDVMDRLTVDDRAISVDISDEPAQ